MVKKAITVPDRRLLLPLDSIRTRRGKNFHGDYRFGEIDTKDPRGQIATGKVYI